MKSIIRFYPILYSWYVIKICYIHTGYDDRCLLWLVNGKLMDFLFIKINN